MLLLRPVGLTGARACPCLPAGVCALAAALASPRCGLRSLQLGRNRGGDAGASALGAALAGAFSQAAPGEACSPHQLPFAHLADPRTPAEAAADAAERRAGSSSATATASGSGFPALTALNLAFNGIGPVGCEALSRALRVNRTLARLNLRINPVGDFGARVVADAVLKGSSGSALVELVLGRVALSDAGAAALAVRNASSETEKHISSSCIRNHRYGLSDPDNVLIHLNHCDV